MEARLAGPAESPAARKGQARADYGWLAEMLWHRVAELKRYPSSARLNGWEGKVVVRAVVREDGHLAELTVRESSGYEELDRAAMDTVRLACPLKLSRELGRAHVVVQIPISYSLTTN
jgi:protein TonB